YPCAQVESCLAAGVFMLQREDSDGCAVQAALSAAHHCATQDRHVRFFLQTAQSYLATSPQAEDPSETLDEVDDDLFFGV
ncbi:MAG: hypothetical protein ACI364_00445, partial [Coriobacteriales bacterium]